MKRWLAKTWGPDFASRIEAENFRVHSVFRSVCNLQAGSASLLLSLVSKEEARGPNSLWLEEISFVDHFKPEMPIAKRDGSLFCGSVEIDCAYSLLYQPPLKQYGQDRAKWQQIENWLENQNPGFSRTKSELTKKIMNGLGKEESDSLLSGIRGFVGAGEGLTPAGDDFVAGVLTAYVRGCRNTFSNNVFLEELALELGRIWLNTNTISQTMLLYSLQGEGALYVTELIDSIYTNNQQAMNQAVRLWRVGASSGRHLLAGILLGCEIFWARENDDGREN